MLIGRIGHIHRRTTNELLERQGVSGGQPPVLKYLSENNGCIQRDLADYCHVKAATISSVLDNMEASGYIERRAMPEDRRVQRIFLTEYGRKKHDLTHKVFTDVEDTCLEGFTDDEVAALKNALDRILVNLQAYGGETEVKE